MDTAGLNSAPAAPMQAGLMTMQQLYEARQSMAKQGLTPAQIDTQLGYPTPAPLASATPAEPAYADQLSGPLDIVGTAGIDTAASVMHGLGTLVRENTPATDVGAWMEGAGDAMSAAVPQPLRDRLAKTQAAADAETGITGFIDQTSMKLLGAVPSIGVAAVGSLAAAPIAVAAGGGALATLASGVTGAAITTFPMNFDESHKRAAASGQDMNDPTVQNTALAAGLAKSVLDGFGAETAARCWKRS
jgi:hypothetical protein